MEEPKKPPQLRLVFQGSIPIKSIEDAKAWYDDLKKELKTQSDAATLNGQIILMLEPCCGKPRGGVLPGTVQNIGPSPYSRL